MKNKLLILTTILISLNGISCSSSIIGHSDGPTAIYIDEQPDFLLRKGLDLIHEIHDLANDSNYVKYVATRTEITQRVQEFASANCQSDYKVFAIDNLKPFTDYLSRIAPSLDSKLYERLYRSIPALINAQSGSTALAATSLLTGEDVFHSNRPEAPCIYLYCFNKGINCLVLFIPQSERIVQAYASWIINQQLDCIKGPDDVETFFKDVLNIPNIHIKQLK
ncbi:MAG TPA: hypothetical protein H9834_04865 [Candidatus Barnesiella excrementavium]|nr:hypothetical protein [Candidatus Barnesiella excrementavium]